MPKNTEPRSLDVILTEAWVYADSYADATLARKIDKLVREAYDRGRKDARWS